MFSRPRTDFWKVGIAPLPAAEVDRTTLADAKARCVWLPDAGAWRYFADPFGIIRGTTLHVFVEAFDYRDKRGVIERHDFALPGFECLASACVLDLPFHLSYPYVFEHGGQIYMVPESAKANEIALYRAVDDRLDHWQRVSALIPDLPGVDASVVEHDGRWWMFYSILGADARDQRELHVAWAPALEGPWRPAAGNPVRNDRSGARPAGKPFRDRSGKLVLPVQDSSGGYGSALRLLRFDVLEPERIRCEMTSVRLTGELVSDDHTQGLHTLSSCGPLTLFDVKRIDRSRHKRWLDLRRRARRLLGLTR